jgi:hypothetical protein
VEPRRVFPLAHPQLWICPQTGTDPFDSLERRMGLQMMSGPNESIGDATAAISAGWEGFALNGSDLVLLGVAVIVLDRIDSGFRNKLAGFITHDRVSFKSLAPLARRVGRTGALTCAVRGPKGCVAPGCLHSRESICQTEAPVGHPRLEALHHSRWVLQIFYTQVNI